VPKPFHAEFRLDVVAVAGKHEVPLKQIEKDLGIYEATMRDWLKKADIEDGVVPSVVRRGRGAM
jgi:transposase